MFVTTQYLTAFFAIISVLEREKDCQRNDRKKQSIRSVGGQDDGSTIYGNTFSECFSTNYVWRLPSFPQFTTENKIRPNLESFNFKL